MDYNKIYTKLIEKGKNRLPEDGVYYEYHHIVPKCMGGSNDINNLVKLTYREHFVAHWLLHLIYPNEIRLQFAFKFMAYGKWSIKVNRIIKSSRILEENKIKLIKSFSSDVHIQKVKAGRIKSKEKKAKALIRTKQEDLDTIRERELEQFLTKSM